MESDSYRSEKDAWFGRRDYLTLGVVGIGASMVGLGVGSGNAKASSSDDYLNLVDDVPETAMELWENKPSVREEFDTLDASDYDDRSGDLSELIEEASAQNAIVDLGSGTYEMSSTVTGDGDVAGVVGDGPDDATVYYRGTELEYLFNTRNQPSGVLEGVTFDISETADGENNTDVGLLYGDFSEEFWAEDIVLRGQRHRHQDLDGDGNYETVGGRFTFQVEMTQTDAEGFMHRCRFPDGGTDMHEEIGDTIGHAIGPNADPNHEGVNVWKECYCSGFADNGFYVSNSPGRNVLWDCHAENNMSGNMRLSSNDYVVGGTSEINDIPDGRSGQCLTHDRGDNVRVVGLECIGTDEYGAEAIQVRSDAEEIELDRVVLRTDESNRPVRFSATGSEPRVEVNITDCYWHDEYPEDNGLRTVLLRNADVTSDADWRVLGEGRLEVQVNDDASLSHAGTSYSSGTHTADELGIEDPRQFDGGLPEFYFEYE